jgi:hypothetical protein
MSLGRLRSTQHSHVQNSRSRLRSTQHSHVQSSRGRLRSIRHSLLRKPLPLRERKSLQQSECLKPMLDMAVESHPNVEGHDVRMGHPTTFPKYKTSTGSEPRCFRSLAFG